MATVGLVFLASLVHFALSLAVGLAMFASVLHINARRAARSVLRIEWVILAAAAIMGGIVIPFTPRIGALIVALLIVLVIALFVVGLLYVFGARLLWEAFGARRIRRRLAGALGPVELDPIDAAEIPAELVAVAETLVERGFEHVAQGRARTGELWFVLARALGAVHAEVISNQANGSGNVLIEFSTVLAHGEMLLSTSSSDQQFVVWPGGLHQAILDVDVDELLTYHSRALSYLTERGYPVEEFGERSAREHWSWARNRQSVLVQAMDNRALAEELVRRHRIPEAVQGPIEEQPSTERRLEQL